MIRNKRVLFILVALIPFCIYLISRFESKVSPPLNSQPITPAPAVPCNCPPQKPCPNPPPCPTCPSPNPPPCPDPVCPDKPAELRCPTTLEEVYSCSQFTKPVPFPPRQDYHILRSFPVPKPKLRILFVTYITANFVPRYEVFLSARHCYTNRHGYSNAIETYRLQTGCNIHYNKIRVLMKYLPFYDYVVYADADHWISRPEKPLQMFLLPDKDIYINLCALPECPIDAGSIVLRNSPATFEFLKLWLDLGLERDMEWVNKDNGVLHHAIAMFLKSKGHPPFANYTDELAVPVYNVSNYWGDETNLWKRWRTFFGEVTQDPPHFHFWEISAFSQYWDHSTVNQYDFMTHSKTLNHTLDSGNQVYCTVTREDLQRQYGHYRDHPEWLYEPFEIEGYVPVGDEPTPCVPAEPDGNPRKIRCDPNSPHQVA